MHIIWKLAISGQKQNEESCMRLSAFLPNIQSRQGWVRWVQTPRTGKNCCRKMILFPKARFLAKTSPKIDKNSIFLLNFHQRFPKLSQNLSSICSFRPNARKINAWFVKSFENYAKIMQFCNFRKNSFANFRKFTGVLGLRPRTPYEAGHNLEPPEICPAYATGVY